MKKLLDLTLLMCVCVCVCDMYSCHNDMNPILFDGSNFDDKKKGSRFSTWRDAVDDLVSTSKEAVRVEKVGDSLLCCARHYYKKRFTETL